MQTPIPPENTNQTLIWRETWTTGIPKIVDASHLGTFDGVTLGGVVAGVQDGPTWLGTPGDQTTRQRWCSAVPDAHDSNGGGNSFQGYRLLSGGLPNCGVISLWLRPTGRFGQAASSTQQSVFLFTDSSAQNFGFILSLLPYSPTGIRFANLLGGAPAGPVISPNSWCLAWLAWENDVWETWAQAEGSSPQQLSGSSNSGGAGFPRSSAARAYVDFSGGQSHPSFCGQAGPMSLHSATNMAAARIGPGGYLWPRDSGPYPTFTVDPISGNDANLLGPWRTYTAFQQACDQLIIMGNPSKNISSGGAVVGLSDFPTADSRDELGQAVVSGWAKPYGPTVNFLRGRHIHNTDWKFSPSGCFLNIKEGAVLSAADTMNGSWVRDDAGNHPKCWRYTGAVGTGYSLAGRTVWANDRRAFTPVFGANLSAAQSTLDATDWAVYTDSSGSTTISLPSGTNINSVGISPLWGSVAPASPNFDGCWVKMHNTAYAEFYRSINYQTATTNQLIQLNAFQLTTGTTLTVFENCQSVRGGRKWGGFARDSNDSAVIVITPSMSFMPPMQTTSTVGVSNQAWIGYTDQATGDFDQNTRPAKHTSYYYRPKPPGVQALDVPGSNIGQALPNNPSWNYQYQWITHGTATYITGIRRITVIDPPQYWIAAGSPAAPFDVGSDVFPPCVEVVASFAPYPAFSTDVLANFIERANGPLDIVKQWNENKSTLDPVTGNIQLLDGNNTTIGTRTITTAGGLRVRSVVSR